VAKRKPSANGGAALLAEAQLHLYSSGPYSYAPMSRAAVLGLEDGSAWWGEAFGDASAAWGEVVFNTAMTGYQEIASDASYNGQIVVLTYPLIGNYGTFDRASESRRPWVEALVVRELDTTCRDGTLDLDAYLRQYGVPGIAGVDTRALVRRLRAKGTLRGALLQVPPHLAHDPGVAQEATCVPCDSSRPSTQSADDTSPNAVSREWLNAYERGLGERYSLHASDPHMGWDDS